jgi:hypothetical protein
MHDRQDLYCKIFVNGAPAREDLIQLVARTVGGTFEFHAVVAAGAEIYVSHNDEDDALRAREPDGFLFYPYYLDVTAEPGQTRSAQIALVATLLEAFWAAKLDAVAACDFEEELPRRGGYHPDLPRRPA